MPPTGSLNLSLQVAGNATVNTSGNDDERIWTQILSEVSANGMSNSAPGTILFLGNRQSGKSWLLNRLEKRETSGRGSALEYHFLNVHTDYRDVSYAYQLASAGAGVAPGESVTLPVWVLDGDVAFAPLVKFALTAPLSKSIVILCASMQEPGAVLPSLNKWVKVISDQIENIFDKATVIDARKSQELFWQEYVEPLDSSMQSDKIPSMETEHVLLPLEQNILTRNTGAALVVVLTKSDLAHNEMSDEQLDRLQYHVRKFCMAHGAALVYTSAKEEKNTALLYKYVVHRVCGMPFTTPAQVVDKDSVFVPAGWDNEKKLDIIKEAIPDVDHPLAMVRERQSMRDQIMEAEEEQAFLHKLASVEIASPKRTAPPPKQTSEGADGNSPLVSFFNNLLRTKEGQAAQTNRATIDPQAQLQRMLEQVNNSATSSAAKSNGEQTSVTPELHSSQQQSS
ncbi:dynein light intermediate chain, putative [Brugia malayi]|uniref:Dynein light intermediate chain n=1 Tax=Brugia malayi TaxID=6279 RepID=A0A1U7F3S8_BRUMA|nr:dynein light intermediate chain, putative [Brugia malayi]CRZ23235.1 BMA-DLI-1 [Brugia malayi]VIO95914.1 dynein light intermediate chain, putative [Brugia malayi]